MTIPILRQNTSNILVLDMFPITNTIYMNIILINENIIIIKLINQYRQSIIHTNSFCIKTIPEMTHCIAIPGTKIYALDYNSKYQFLYNGIILFNINSTEEWHTI